MKWADLQASDKFVFREYFARNEWLQARSGKLRNVRWCGKRSENAFCFATPGRNEIGGWEDAWRDVLCGIGDEINTTKAREMFFSAVSGKGNEWRKITQLNSSSLLAYLTFGCLKHPVEIKLPDGSREEFGEVYLEVENPFPSRYPRSSVSSMDIVLVNETSVVFLESKFTEYIEKCSSSERMSYDQYWEDYEHIFGGRKIRLGNMDGKILKDGSDLVIESLGRTHYLQGIKQMVSHCIGLSGGNIAANCDALRTKIKGKNRYLGEVVFDFQGCDSKGSSRIKSHERLKDYQKIHADLVKDLKPLADRGETVLFQDLLTYQELISSDHVPSAVAKLYDFKS